MAGAGAGAGVGARYLHPAWWDEGVLQLWPPKCAAAAAWAPQQHYEWHEDPQLLPFYAVVGMPTPEVLGLISSIVEQTACGEESLGELPGEAVEGLSRTSSVTSVSNACFWYGDDDGGDGDWREEGERGRRRSSGRTNMRRSGGSVEFAQDQLQSVRVIPPRAAVRLSGVLEDAGLLGLGSVEENRRFFEASAARVAQWAAGGRGEVAAAAPLRASANPWGIGQADGPVYYSEYCAGWRLLRAEYEGDAASLARDLRVVGPVGRAILAGIPAAAAAAAAAEGLLFEAALENLCDEAGLSSAAEAAAAAAAEFRARMGGPAKAVVDDLPDEEDCEGDFDVDDMGCGGDDY
jgi:hypothetical protein